MHGRTFRQIALIWPLLFLLLAGCDEPSPPPPGPEPCPEAASLFDARTAGTITGRVTWAGPRPTVAPFRSCPRPLAGAEGGGDVQSWPNPHAPQISPQGEVRNAVVFLRGVPPQRARPWDHAPVPAQLDEHQLRLWQGDVQRPFAFVRRGASIEMVSAQDDFPSLQGRGANFFARTFPEAGLVLTQRLARPGVVELMSGSGAFWMRGHLFVDDVPYYTATSVDGRFSIESVPPGDYELVCWLPNWRVAEHDLDGDTGRVWRVAFHPALSVARPVRQGPRQIQSIDFVLSAP